METKTEVAYRKVLGQFKTKFPNVRPTSVMIDFETGLHNAFQQTYPEATILSCWFNFVQVGNLNKYIFWTLKYYLPTLKD